MIKYDIYKSLINSLFVCSGLLRFKTVDLNPTKTRTYIVNCHRLINDLEYIDKNKTDDQKTTLLESLNYKLPVAG